VCSRRGGGVNRSNRRGRLVIVGNGMAATRLVETLVRLEAGYEITVVGDEHHLPYNRILLSAVLAGTHPREDTRLKNAQWYVEHGVEVVSGERVRRIERAAGHVELEGGRRIEFDQLVLATGSNPLLPPIRGILATDGQLRDDVHAFRSMDDCDRLLAAAPKARRAIVVGGGLLGLQVARALGALGVQVEIVEVAPQLMTRQLGVKAATVLARSVRQLGTTVYTEARAIAYSDEGLRLDNGYLLTTDLLVLAVGSRPSTSLAREAGLMVRTGIVVGDDLASVTDRRIFAIGDCAEHRGRVHGFVAPAWEQATTLARILGGQTVRYAGSRVVARLRAEGLEVAVLGDPEVAQGEVVEVANPVRGSYRKVVMRDGVLQAAVLLGDLSAVGLLTQLYDRQTVLGVDEPGGLLLGERHWEARTDLPDSAEVCSCAGVSAGQVRACRSFEAAVERTRATTGCGGCSSVVRALIETARTTASV
jgi:NAD(P)H-nitrite reductase large subunit